jgi:hypothetical protein
MNFRSTGVKHLHLVARVIRVKPRFNPIRHGKIVGSSSPVAVVRGCLHVAAGISSVRMQNVNIETFNPTNFAFETVYTNGHKGLVVLTVISWMK